MASLSPALLAYRRTELLEELKSGGSGFWRQADQRALSRPLKNPERVEDQQAEVRSPADGLKSSNGGAWLSTWQSETESMKARGRSC